MHMQLHVESTRAKNVPQPSSRSTLTTEPYKGTVARGNYPIEELALVSKIVTVV